MSVIILGLIASISSQQTPWKFGVIGDTQANPRILKRAVADMRTRNLKFVINLGDLHWCHNLWAWKRQRSIFKKTGIPWYVTLGNHELYKCKSGRFTYRPWAKQRWVNFWYKGKGDTLRYFKYRGKQFVLMDSSTYLVPKGHNSRIKKLLDKSKYNFIFSHRAMPYPGNFKVFYGPRKKYFTWYKRLGGLRYVYRNKHLWNTLKSRQDRIMAIFHGHHHAFRKYNLDRTNCYCSGGGGGWLENKISRFHYLVVEVKGNNYKVKTVDLGR